MGTIRWTVLALAAILVVPAAWGQVAAPRLTPLQGGLPALGPIIFGATDVTNPATLVWAGSSYFGAAAMVPGHVERNAGGPPNGTGTQSGELVQTRIVKDHVALGGTFNISELEVVDTVGGVTRARRTFDSRFDLGLRFTDWLTLGVMRHHTDQEYREFPPFQTDARRQHLTMAGATMRFWGNMYLGYGSGNETVRIENGQGLPVNGQTEEATRKIVRSGIALYERSEGWSYHLEIYQESRDAYQLPLSFPSYSLDDAGLTGYNLELSWHGWLAAYERFDTNITRLNPALVEYQNEAQRFTLGYVPREGLAYLLTGYRGRRLIAPQELSHEALEVGVAWQF